METETVCNKILSLGGYFTHEKTVEVRNLFLTSMENSQYLCLSSGRFFFNISIAF